MAFQDKQIILNGWFLDNPKVTDEYAIAWTITVPASTEKTFEALSLTFLVGGTTYLYKAPIFTKVEIFNNIYNDLGATLSVFPNKASAGGDNYIIIPPGSYYTLHNQFVFTIYGDQYNDAQVSIVFYVKPTPLECVMSAV